MDKRSRSWLAMRFVLRCGSARRRRRLLEVPAELIAHRRQHLVRKQRFAAGTESFVQRGGEHMGRNALVDRGLDGPAALPGIGDPSGEGRWTIKAAIDE